jgi:TPR repeat protein
MYARGIEVEIDLDTAIYLNSIAAKKGIPTAMHNLAICLLRRRAIEADLVHGIVWINRGEKHRLRKSMESLCIIYTEDDGVAQDLEIGSYWRQRALTTV